jgi:hypothetical protein
MLKTSLPAAVVVSMAAFVPGNLQADAAPSQVVHGVEGWRRSRPASDPVSTTSVSPVPQRLQAARQAGPILACRMPVLVKMYRIDPAAISASRCKSVAWEPSAFDTRM